MIGVALLFIAPINLLCGNLITLMSYVMGFLIGVKWQVGQGILGTVEFEC